MSRSAARRRSSISDVAVLAAGVPSPWLAGRAHGLRPAPGRALVCSRPPPSSRGRSSATAYGARGHGRLPACGEPRHVAEARRVRAARGRRCRSCPAAGRPAAAARDAVAWSASPPRSPCSSSSALVDEFEGAAPASASRRSSASTTSARSPGATLRSGCRDRAGSARPPSACSGRAASRWSGSCSRARSPASSGRRGRGGRRVALTRHAAHSRSRRSSRSSCAGVVADPGRRLRGGAFLDALGIEPALDTDAPSRGELASGSRSPTSAAASSSTIRSSASAGRRRARRDVRPVPRRRAQPLPGPPPSARLPLARAPVGGPERLRAGRRRPGRLGPPSSSSSRRPRARWRGRAPRARGGGRAAVPILWLLVTMGVWLGLGLVAGIPLVGLPGSRSGSPPRRPNGVPPATPARGRRPQPAR